MLNDGAMYAREALEALRGLHALRDGRPTGIDRFVWSADVLDDLARLAAHLGQAVEDASGEEDPALRSAADALSTMIVAHRNSLLHHGLTRPSPRSGPARRDEPAAHGR